jgi:hypothetical protein
MLRGAAGDHGEGAVGGTSDLGSGARVLADPDQRTGRFWGLEMSEGVDRGAAHCRVGLADVQQRTDGSPVAKAAERFSCAHLCVLGFKSAFENADQRLDSGVADHFQRSLGAGLVAWMEMMAERIGEREAPVWSSQDADQLVNDTGIVQFGQRPESAPPGVHVGVIQSFGKGIARAEIAEATQGIGRHPTHTAVRIVESRNERVVRAWIPNPGERFGRRGDVTGLSPRAAR